ncbi:hypothetical protein, partial [Mesorhizobium sp. M1396]|uniref:hypothetical protein n=1 Tax=Mesorhizobium sp. M1396 TaxID=2957095 RepID=UPI003339C8DD
GVRQYKSRHSKLESQSGSKWNPESQQALGYSIPSRPMAEHGLVAGHPSFSRRPAPQLAIKAACYGSGRHFSDSVENRSGRFR